MGAEPGVGTSAFLQTMAGNKVHEIVSNDKQENRSTLLAFLKGSSEYAPQSGQITGILKQLEDEMAAGLAEAIATEEAIIKAYGELEAMIQDLSLLHI